MNIAVTLALSIAQVTQSGPVLTLDEAIRIAEANAFSIRIEQSRVGKARQRFNEIRGLVRPKVVVGSSYVRSDNEPTEQTFASVTLSTPVDVTGVLGRGVRGAQAAVAVAESNLEVERNKLVFDVRFAYYDVLRKKALVAVADQSLTSAGLRLKNENVRLQVGEAAQADVQRFATQFAQAEADLVAANAALDLAKQNLNSVLARPIETAFEPLEPSSLPTVKPSAEELASAGVRRRPEIASIRAQRVVLDWVRRAQEGGLLPSLNLIADFTQNVGSASSGTDRTRPSATLALSWPIYDSGVTRSRVGQAKQDERIAFTQQEQIELGVSLEVRQALTRLRDADSRLEVASRQVTFARETHRLAQIRLDAGVGTSLEVSDAQTELTRALNAQTNARYDYLTAYAQLQKAVAADDPNTIDNLKAKESSR